MILLSAEESAVLELLDPASACRLVIGRTGRAFVWDPIARTTEVPAAAARALVAQGIVDSRGRIAPQHAGLWRQGKAAPRAAAPRPAPRPAAPLAAAEGEAGRFERTLPLARSSEALRAMG